MRDRVSCPANMEGKRLLSPPDPLCMCSADSLIHTCIAFIQIHSKVHEDEHSSRRLACCGIGCGDKFPSSSSLECALLPRLLPLFSSHSRSPCETHSFEPSSPASLSLCLRLMRWRCMQISSLAST